MKKLIVLMTCVVLTSCGSDDSKDDKKESPKLSACDCKEVSAQISKAAQEGKKFDEIEAEIGKGKMDVCSKMFQDKDYMEKVKECD